MEPVTNEEIIQNALTFINKQETLFTLIINIQYYILTLILSFLNMSLYKKTFQVFDIEINDTIFITEKKVTILDKGIELWDNFIPYEYIMRFGYNEEGYAHLDILGKETVTKMSFMCSDPEYMMRLIKNNMYYHIKYNSIDKNVIGRYNPKKQD